MCGARVLFLVVSKYVACSNEKPTKWIAVNVWAAQTEWIRVVTRVSDIKCLQYRGVSIRHGLQRSSGNSSRLQTQDHYKRSSAQTVMLK